MLLSARQPGARFEVEITAPADAAAIALITKLHKIKSFVFDGYARLVFLLMRQFRIGFRRYTGKNMGKNNGTTHFAGGGAIGGNLFGSMFRGCGRGSNTIVGMIAGVICTYLFGDTLGPIVASLVGTGVLERIISRLLIVVGGGSILWDILCSLMRRGGRPPLKHKTKTAAGTKGSSRRFSMRSTILFPGLQFAF